MLSRYDLILSDDGQTYQFKTDSGDQYTAYFTEFFLQNEQGEEFKISSFGFDRLKTSSDPFSGFDDRIKLTIQYIITTFFDNNPEDAVLYICLPGDGMARNRRITFSRWFNELRNRFVKCDSHIKYAEYNFYSSLILLVSNPNKEVLINAFNYTLEYWMAE